MHGRRGVWAAVLQQCGGSAGTHRSARDRQHGRHTHPHHITQHCARASERAWQRWMIGITRHSGTGRCVMCCCLAATCAACRGKGCCGCWPSTHTTPNSATASCFCAAAKAMACTMSHCMTDCRDGRVCGAVAAAAVLAAQPAGRASVVPAARGAAAGGPASTAAPILLRLLVRRHTHAAVV